MRSAAPLAEQVNSEASALTLWPGGAAGMGVEAGVSQAPGIFPALASTRALLNGSPSRPPSEDRGGVSPSPLPRRVLSPQSPRVWKTLGHLCCPLTSLWRHPRAPSQCRSVSSALPGALSRVPWRTLGRIRRRPHPLGTNRRWAGAGAPVLWRLVRLRRSRRR